MGEGARATVREMGTRKRRKSSNPTISTGERGSREEHDSTQGQEEGKSHAQDAGARAVCIYYVIKHERVYIILVLDRTGNSYGIS